MEKMLTKMLIESIALITGVLFFLGGCHQENAISQMQDVSITRLSLTQLFTASDVIVVGRVVAKKDHRSSESRYQRLCSSFVIDQVHIEVREKIRGIVPASTEAILAPRCVVGALHDEANEMLIGGQYLMFLRSERNYLSPVYPGSMFALAVEDDPFDLPKVSDFYGGQDDKALKRVTEWLANYARVRSDFRWLNQIVQLAGANVLIEVMFSDGFITDSNAGAICADLIEDQRLFHREDLLRRCQPHFSSSTKDFIRDHIVALKQIER